MAQGKSFLGSLTDGVKGFAKGLLAGGVAGALIGGVVGATIGLLTGGVGIVGAMALAGALNGGAILASIAAPAGTVTGVIKGREAAQPSTQDVVNLANMAFAQGVAVGHERAMENPEKSQQESRQFRDMIEKQRMQAAMQGKAIH